MTSISTAHFISTSSASAVSNSGDPNRRFHSLPSRFPPFSIEFPQSTLCRCQISSSSGSDESGGDKRRRWDYMLQESFKNAVKRWESYVRSLPTGFPEGENEVEDSEVEDGVEKVSWDWERWKRHFDEVEEQEKNLELLKAQLQHAIYKEEYEDAIRLQGEISDAEYNDAVTNAVKQMNIAIEDEQYYEAASIRDNAGTGLIGWWSGVSEDPSNPRGQIIHVKAEHGRYVARSYTSRQLVSGRSGSPFFEIYFIVGDNGEYNSQAVYLQKKKGDLKNTKNGLLENPGIQLTVKNPKPLDPSSIENNDMDLIFNVIEEVIEEDDEEDNFGDKDDELEIAKLVDGFKKERGFEVVGSVNSTIDSSYDESDNLSMEFVTSAIKQNLYRHPTDFVRMPATLEKLGCFSFSFSVVTDILHNDSNSREYEAFNKVLRSPTNLPTFFMSDLSKAIPTGEGIPLEIINDLADLINIALNNEKDQQPFKGKIFFNRINLSATLDPLNGLYISTAGIANPGVIYLKRKFGQWHEDGKNQDSLEFYEYVEALQITGDRLVPAGEIAFRAKVGEKNQLSDQGMLPEELGVVTRYKGRGRLADPGFKNPRWVDGELVIMKGGKFLRGGSKSQDPVIGFVYWAAKDDFLALFSRLHLPK